MSVGARDEAERLRAAAAGDAEERSRFDPRAAGGAATLVVRTRAASVYPKVAGAFYSVVAAGVLGAEVEGQAGSITPAGDPFLALNLGKTIPPVGTTAVATFVANRWVFRYG